MIAPVPLIIASLVAAVVVQDTSAPVTAAYPQAIASLLGSDAYKRRDPVLLRLRRGIQISRVVCLPEDRRRTGKGAPSGVGVAEPVQRDSVSVGQGAASPGEPVNITLAPQSRAR